MLPLSRSISSRRLAGSLYGAVVAAARDPIFYRDLGVPDTIEGRYEMIVLHLTLALRRLRDPDVRQRRLAQNLVDYMAADLDRSIRELGVGDLSVARFMKRLGEGLYGRAAAYDDALDQGLSEPLMAAVLRNIYADANPGGHILATFAAYITQQQSCLMNQPVERLASGKIDFLSPNECRARC